MTQAQLVGRAPELAELLGALESLRTTGRGSLVLVSGEPGIGKTRLVDELVSRALGGGTKVAWGAAWDGGGAPAFWPWIEIVRSLRPHLPAPDEELRRDLGPLWDDRAEDPRSHDPDLLRFRRFDALRAVLAAAAAPTPLLVVLDDLHAADRDSLLALHFVARALRTLPVLLIGTHREAEARLDPALGELLARIGREGRSLVLARLDRVGVGAMTADLDSVSPLLIDEIFQASGGNPLFVNETLRRVRTGARPTDVRDGAAALLRERLARFDPATRDALDLAALLGREVNWELFADALGVTRAQALQRLRGPRLAGIIEDRDLVERDDSSQPRLQPSRGDRFCFAHGLYRERLVDDLTGDRRCELHLLAGRAHARRLAAGHPDAEEPMARHLLAALPAGDAAAAVTAASSAATAALRALAFDRGIALYEGALAALAHLPPDPARLIDIRLPLAEALARTGAGERGRALCLLAADEARAIGDGVRLARAALGYGAEIRVAHVDPVLISLLREALQALGEQRADLRAEVMGRLAAAMQPDPQPDIPIAIAREAVALARSTGNAATLLFTLHTAGSALVDYAPPEERLALSRELCALALPQGELTLALRGYGRMTMDCLELGDRAGAEDALAAYERMGQALGHARWQWRAPLMRSMLALIDGRWDDAAGAMAQARDVAARSDDQTAQIALLVHELGALRAREAELPSAMMPAHPAFESVTYVAAVVPIVRASLAAKGGDRDGARRHLATVPQDLTYFQADPVPLSLLAEATAVAEDGQRASWLLDRLAPFAGRNLTWGLFGHIWEGPVVQWIALLLGSLDRWDEAIVAYEKALAGAEAMPSPPLVARLKEILARALLARGRSADVERARHLIETAGQIAGRLDMPMLVSRLAGLAASFVTGAAAAHAAGTPKAHGAEPMTEQPPEIALTREGEIWTISGCGATVRLRHSRALEILAELVRHPGRDFHVLDFGAGDGDVIDAGDAGVVLDAAARAAYRQRIGELRRDLGEAEAWADPGRSDRLRAELELLEEQLAGGVGLGGRERRAGANVERARVNVQKRLRGLTRKIAESAPALARHLESQVRTGTWVCYRRAT